MIATVPDILARIVEHKRAELACAAESIDSLAVRAQQPRRDFVGALRSRRIAVIAEIKKASPSKGLLSENFDPPEIARQYESGGAAALSVLTDHQFFQGSFEHLQAARSAVSMPVLRKDFTVEPYHVYEAAANAADALLLIAAILTESELRTLRELAEGLGLAALVEVHDRSELDRAIGSGAKIIGVNNRDLHTFEVRLETSLELADAMPSGTVRVSESGIHSRRDVDRLRDAGYTTFLVGEHLMRSSDPAAAVRELVA